MMVSGFLVTSELNNEAVPNPHAPYKFGADCASDKPCEMPILLSKALEITTGKSIFSINANAAEIPPDGAHLITAISATSFVFERS